MDEEDDDKMQISLRIIIHEDDGRVPGQRPMTSFTVVAFNELN